MRWNVYISKYMNKEVQAHGFRWEREISCNVYGATHEELKTIPYTNKSDLPANFNQIDSCDVSIKTTKSKNTVCMADCLRVFDSVSSGSPMHVTVIYYKQCDNLKKIITITEVDLTDSRKLLFGTVTRRQLEKLDAAVKSVPRNRKPTKAEHTKMWNIQKILKVLSGAIYFNIKCNTTQSRLQCSFNKFQNFIEKNPSRIIANSNTNEFRGGVISSEIISQRRVFK